MNRRQFKLLYREFRRSAIDLDWLSAHGDASALGGRVIALLVVAGCIFAWGVNGVEQRLGRLAALAQVWNWEASVVATTFFVLGVLAVVSWDSVLPGRNDLLVLGALPLSPLTLLAAKGAASLMTFAAAGAALNVPPALLLAVALADPNKDVIDLFVQTGIYQSLAAALLTSAAVVVLSYGVVAFLQMSAALLLPRRVFLRASSLLQALVQVGAFFVMALPPGPAAGPRSGMGLSPVRWMGGLFQWLAGSDDPAMALLAFRAIEVLAAVVASTAVIGLCFYRWRVKETIDYPDLVPSHRRGHFPVPGAWSVRKGIAEFVFKTLVRSRQHRFLLTFYVGIGAALVLVMLKMGAGRVERGSAPLVEQQVVWTGLLMTLLWVLGLRIVASVPFELRSNWIFRVHLLDPSGRPAAAAQTAMLMVMLLPVALFALASAPWLSHPLAVSHGLILLLEAAIIACVSLGGFVRIPFACSYTPGKLPLHLAIVGLFGLLWALGRFTAWETDAAKHGGTVKTLAVMVGLLVLAVGWMRNRTGTDAQLEFDDEEEDNLQRLDVYPDGFVPR